MGAPCWSGTLATPVSAVPRTTCSLACPAPPHRHVLQIDKRPPLPPSLSWHPACEMNDASEVLLTIYESIQAVEQAGREREGGREGGIEREQGSSATWRQ